MKYVYARYDRDRSLSEEFGEDVELCEHDFQDLALFRRRLTEIEEKNYELVYLGKIGD